MELHYLGPMMPCSLLDWNSSSETKTTLGFQSSTLNVINSSIFLDSSGSMICSSDRGIRHQQVFFVVPMQFVGVHWRLTGWIWSDLILWDMMHIAYIAYCIYCMAPKPPSWFDVGWAPQPIIAIAVPVTPACHLFCYPCFQLGSNVICIALQYAIQCNMHCTSATF